MPIADTDLVFYGSLNRPEDDISTSGGAIDTDHRMGLTQLAASDTVEMLSDNAGDTTQNVTVTGRDAAGAVVSEQQTLNGTTVVSFTPTFERILKIVMDADATGTITVRRSSAGPTVATIPPGERGAFANFIKSASQSSPVTRFEKLFGRNSHGTLTLNDAEVELTADPDARIRMGLAATKDDSGSVANRVTAPGGITFVDDGVAQSVPGTTLEAGSGIGVWVEQALLADDPPFNSTFTLQLKGTSV
ncbi:MAG TPA: hypothetical protein VLV83_08840 [Acidobacteriota bacterium]|nr:hypothetical protein [Acidobacteriota bacterium]